MEIFNAKVIGSRPVTLTNPESGVSRKFTIVACSLVTEETTGTGKVAKTEEVTQNIEVWVDRLESPPKRGTTVGVSQDSEERWNIWF